MEKLQATLLDASRFGVSLERMSRDYAMMMKRLSDTVAVFGQVGDTLVSIGSFLLSTGTEGLASERYAAFPALEKAADGELIGMWNRAGSHNERNGLVNQERTTGGGLIWGGYPSETLYWDTKPKSLPNNQRQGDTGPALLQLHNTDHTPARLFSAWRVRDNPDGMATYDYMRWSDDGGITWTSPPDALKEPAGIGYDAAAALPKFGYVNCRPGGNPIELEHGGDILWPCFVNVSGSSRYDIIMIVSSDGGHTWAQRGAALPNPASLQMEEPQVIRLDDTRLLMLFRVDNTHQIYRCWSYDEAETWTTPEVVFEGFGRPNVIQLSSGVLFATSRHWDPTPPVVNATHNSINNEFYYAFYRISRDRGQTWGAEQKMVDEMYLYANHVEHPTGTLNVLMAYGDRTSLVRTKIALFQYEV